MYVVLPYALPTSLAVVSLNLLQKLATNPAGRESGAKHIPLTKPHDKTDKNQDANRANY